MEHAAAHDIALVESWGFTRNEAIEMVIRRALAHERDVAEDRSMESLARHRAYVHASAWSAPPDAAHTPDIASRRATRPARRYAARMTTTRPDVLDASGRARRVVGLLADTATVLVIYALGERRLRYGEIEQRVGGVSQQVLTGTLRELTRHRLVEVVPDGDGYQLSQLGRSLLDEVVAPFCDWARVHADDLRPPAPRPSGGGCAPPRR